MGLSLPCCFWELGDPVPHPLLLAAPCSPLWGRSWMWTCIRAPPRCCLTGQQGEATLVVGFVVSSEVFSVFQLGKSVSCFLHYSAEKPAFTLFIFIFFSLLQHKGTGSHTIFLQHLLVVPASPPAPRLWTLCHSQCRPPASSLFLSFLTVLHSKGGMVLWKKTSNMSEEQRNFLHTSPSEI